MDISYLCQVDCSIVTGNETTSSEYVTRKNTIKRHLRRNLKR